MNLDWYKEKQELLAKLHEAYKYCMAFSVACDMAIEAETDEHEKMFIQHWKEKAEKAERSAKRVYDKFRLS